MRVPRHDWTAEEALGLIGRPFHDLLADAHGVHRQRFDPHVVEGAMLLRRLDSRVAPAPLLGRAR